MWASERQQLVVGAFGYFEESVYLLPLHGLAGFGMAAIHRHYPYTLRSINLMAESPRKIAAILIHYGNGQSLRLPLIHQREEKNVAEHHTQRGQNQITTLTLVAYTTKLTPQ